MVKGRSFLQKVFDRVSVAREEVHRDGRRLKRALEKAQRERAETPAKPTVKRSDR